MTRALIPPLTPFDRVVLVYGLAWRPTGWIDAARLVALAKTSVDPFEIVANSLERLRSADLIIVQRGSAAVSFKRTEPRGLALAEQLLRDRRLSFFAAISDGVTPEPLEDANG